MEKYGSLGYGDTFTLNASGSQMPSNMRLYVNFATAGSAAMADQIYGEWGSNSLTFTTATNLRIRYMGVTWTNAASIDVTLKFKLEKGHRATDWSPGVIDYVIKESSSSTWKYRKWASGKIEAWYKGVISASATTATGNVYSRSWSLTIPSGIFTATPMLNLSLAEVLNNVFGINGAASSTTAITGRVFSTVTANGASNIAISIYAWQD